MQLIDIRPWESVDMYAGSSNSRVSTVSKTYGGNSKLADVGKQMLSWSVVGC